MAAIRDVLRTIKTSGRRLPDSVSARFMGKERTFDAYSLGGDTFIFERGVASRLDDRPSVLIVSKNELSRKARGQVMTLTTGNHAVAAMPLLDGRFWGLSTLPADRRSSVMTRAVLCANVVSEKIELSQREVPTATLVKLDSWLTENVGLGLDGVVMGERNETTLEHFRRLGQEWRVKPLAWTETEMRVALDAARKRIGTRISYFHSARGVHFITLPEFRRFAAFAETEPQSFVDGLAELVGVYEGNTTSFVRQPKYRGHHEVEFFGLRRGTAMERLVPEIESLHTAVCEGRIGQLGVIQRAQELSALYSSLLARPELADESSQIFAETLYMNITGEVYAVVGEGSTPAFDDRRTALPGATFVNGRAVMHPGFDERTELLLSNLRGMMSKDEVVEYANVYEIRGADADVPLGRGATREVVYKTSMRPITYALVEKRLSSSSRGYASYMLARIGALRSLGVALSDYYCLLKRRPGTGRGKHDYYIRRRCEGEPMDAIPADYFRSADGSAVEEKEVVLLLAGLMGDAAAQNMAMKKFDPTTESPLFGVGKEIYDFEYDLVREFVVPKRVSTCSIRGSFGWPCLDYTDANLDAIANFYFGHFAHAVKAYAARHQSVSMADVAERFMGGFEFRTHAMAWQLAVMRDAFEAFDPPVPSCYSFRAKWLFAMWSLERQERRLGAFRRIFLTKVRLVESERHENGGGDA